MTNEALQAFIAEFGDRISILVFDNGVRVYIGYPSSTVKSVSELKFANYGGVDMVGIPKLINNPALARKGVMTTVWHPTELLQVIHTLDEGFDHYRIDPMEIG